MAVTQLLAPTIILNEGGISAAATMPTIPAGSDRVVLVLVCAYNGGGNASPPTAMTCNGRTASYICGDNPAVPQLRAAIGLYMFNETDAAAVSGQSLVTSTATGTVKSIAVMALQDCQQTVPINYNAGRATTGTITLPLTRAANSLTVAMGFTQSAATLLTFANPTRTSSVDFTTRDVSVAVAADTAGTSNFTSSTANGTNNTVLVVNFLTKESFDITGVNGGTNSVQIGSTGNTFTTTGLTGVTSASIKGVAMTSVSGSSSPWSFNCPYFVDEQITPYPQGNFTCTGNEGSPTLAGVDVTLPSNLTAQILAGTLNTTETGVLHNFSPAAVVDDRIIYPPVPAVGKYMTIDAQGNIDTDYAGTTGFWHWQESTGVVRSYDVITGDGVPPIVVKTGLTAIGVTTKGLTVRGLTAKGL